MADLKIMSQEFPGTHKSFVQRKDHLEDPIDLGNINWWMVNWVDAIQLNPQEYESYEELTMTSLFSAPHVLQFLCDHGYINQEVLEATLQSYAEVLTHYPEPALQIPDEPRWIRHGSTFERVRGPLGAPHFLSLSPDGTSMIWINHTFSKEETSDLENFMAFHQFSRQLRAAIQEQKAYNAWAYSYMGSMSLRLKRWWHGG
jgi:hypothetical protein